MATAFNQDIGKWDVSSVKDMSSSKYIDIILCSSHPFLRPLLHAVPALAKTQAPLVTFPLQHHHFFVGRFSSLSPAHLILLLVDVALDFSVSVLCILDGAVFMEAAIFNSGRPFLPVTLFTF
jgi:hypothetical protein